MSPAIAEQMQQAMAGSPKKHALVARALLPQQEYQEFVGTAAPHWGLPVTISTSGGTSSTYSVANLLSTT